MASDRPLIVIVDDDEAIRQAAQSLMESLGYRAATFASADAFLGSPELAEAACLIADVQMPGMSGADLYWQLHGSGSAIPTILITAFPDDRVRQRVLAAGAVCYLVKPFEESDLLRCLQSAIAAGG